MKPKRVVITGLSAITPLGNDLKSSWDAMLAGKSGIGRITQFDSTDFATHIAGEVKDFDPCAYIAPRQSQKMDRFCQFSVCACLQLLNDASYTIPAEESWRTGVVLGVGLGGLKTIEQFHSKLTLSGPNRVSPFYIPMLISNMAPAQVAIHTGARGINTVATSACTSALHAIGYAFDQINLGRADVMISGGAESTITAMGISGFTAMKALCTDHQDQPELASRPFDATRSGFVMGEGAGFLLLEELEHARRRNATIYAEVLGFGASDDAYHMVTPLESGEGMAMCMKNALSDAGIAPDMIDIVSAHGTSTHANDAAETKALHNVFGDHAKKLAITAVKSQIGHLLGASGGVASVFAAMSLATGNVPGTANLRNPDPECDLNYMADGAKKLDPVHAIINSYGFGGTNGSLVLKKYLP